MRRFPSIYPKIQPPPIRPLLAKRHNLTQLATVAPGEDHGEAEVGSKSGSSGKSLVSVMVSLTMSSWRPLGVVDAVRILNSAGAGAFHRPTFRVVEGLSTSG